MGDYLKEPTYFLALSQWGMKMAPDVDLEAPHSTCR